MKKIIISIIILVTSVSLYMNAETINNKINTNSKCEVCQQGHLQKTSQGVIFEFSKNSLEPRFDAVFLKCDHCQSLTPTKEYNGYFSIPAPK